MSFLMSYSITRLRIIVYLSYAWKPALLFIFFMPHLLILTLFYHFLKDCFSIFSNFAWKLLKKLFQIFAKSMTFLIYFLLGYFFFFWVNLWIKNLFLNFSRLELASFIDFFGFFYSLFLLLLYLLLVFSFSHWIFHFYCLPWAASNCICYLWLEGFMIWRPNSILSNFSSYLVFVSWRNVSRRNVFSVFLDSIDCG